MDPIKVYIGFDPREAVAWHVCVQSILDTARKPDEIEFHALNGDPRDGSNSFVYSRFLVPWLCRFTGHALFLDGDMIFRAPIEDLWEQRALARVGVQVVKHNYQTKHPVKYLGAKNENYPRKNWSSVMLWNCGFFPNRCLTPDFVAESPGKYLHNFEWLTDHQVAELGPEWNWLVREYDYNPNAKLLHYTVGIPAFKDYANDPESEDWNKHFATAIKPYEGTLDPA